jgi:Zn-dependent protease
VLLGEPQPTAFDLRFSLFGFPIRVSVWFWLAALLLGQGAASTGPRGILTWMLAVLLSILIHELGHAAAFRRCGISSHIVLYHFGGLAIPETAAWGGYAATRQNPWQEIFISVSGPAAQLLAACLLILGIRLGGHAVPLPSAVLDLLNLGGGEPLPPNELYLFAVFFLYVSLFWALLNLLPVYPLDGGQIARNLFLLFGGHRAIEHSLLLSIATGGFIALYGFRRGQPFLGLMFALLAYSSYQAWQAYGGGWKRRW